MGDAISQIIGNVFTDTMISVILGSFLIGISYIKFGNKLVFKMVIAVMSFVIFAADATVLITSVQILAPDQYTNVLLIILPLGAGIMFVVSFYFLKAIILPLNKITNEAKGLAEGNLTVKIEKTERKDEIGSLTNYLKN